MLDRRIREGVESSAPEVQTDQGCEAVRGDPHRHEQQRAEWPETPLNFKLERGTEQRRRYKQHGWIFPRDHGPRGADALP